MSHTIVELFLKVIPVDLFRAGAKNNPNLHKFKNDAAELARAKF